MNVVNAGATPKTAGPTPSLNGGKEEAEQAAPPLPPELLAGTIMRTATPIGFSDAEGRLLWVNEAFTRQTGLTTRDVQEWTLATFLEKMGANADSVLSMRESMSAGISCQIETACAWSRDSAAPACWVALEIDPIYDKSGRLIRFILLMYDITERKRQEAALVEANAALRRSNQALEEFARIASHDLKEPLRKILTFGDKLQRRLGDTLTPETAGWLDRMTGAARRMNALIEDLLAYSRVSGGGRGASRCLTPLNVIVSEVVADLETTLHDAGAHVDAGPLPELNVDPLLMRQLFQNLIANAVKFRREGVAPVVTIRAERAGANWLLSVADNGIGFEPQYAERIFDPFERLETGPRREGNGIGLAICRRVAEVHGGTIRAEGRPGEGAVFRVTLPG